LILLEKENQNMENFDYDLRSIQEARDLARCGEAAAKKLPDLRQNKLTPFLRVWQRQERNTLFAWQRWL